jgi:hypothetical protein
LILAQQPKSIRKRIIRGRRRTSVSGRQTKVSKRSEQKWIYWSYTRNTALSAQPLAWIKMLYNDTIRGDLFTLSILFCNKFSILTLC